jgi:DNA mismatch endonuclease (patch repair protein)
MVDKLSKEKRSLLMGRIRRADTTPELAVRRLLTLLGYRYRIHFEGVSGRPDIAFPRKRKAIFVHGCFWHYHQGCPSGRIPKSRTKFWLTKFEKNRARDRRQIRELRQHSWSSLVVWECEVDKEDLSKKLIRFLGLPRSTG